MWMDSYPDSVRRVSPPNTTMPKTLAALPSSQYATDLELVSGKKAFFARVDLALMPIVLLSEPSGDAVPFAEGMVLCAGACVDWDRKACRKGVWRRDLYIGADLVALRLT